VKIIIMEIVGGYALSYATAYAERGDS